MRTLKEKRHELAERLGGHRQCTMKRSRRLNDVILSVKCAYRDTLELAEVYRDILGQLQRAKRHVRYQERTGAQSAHDLDLHIPRIVTSRHCRAAHLPTKRCATRPALSEKVSDWMNLRSRRLSEASDRDVAKRSQRRQSGLPTISPLDSRKRLGSTRNATLSPTFHETQDSQAASIPLSETRGIKQRIGGPPTAGEPGQEKHPASNSNLNQGDQMPKPKWPLQGEEYQRYGRQLIMPEIGLQGQLRLKHSSVLIIGLGGLGCPAAAYLAGAGIGRLGFVDGDTVEASNLHRQVLHSTSTIGMSKVASAIRRLEDVNPLVECISHDSALVPEAAVEMISHYDIVLDCTDHPISRYLISDACILAQKPLVSASALRVDGQLTVLNDPPAPAGDLRGGPCYRCVWPRPPPAESITSCGEGGILGPVVGVMGVLMAFETIKMISSGSVPLSVRGDLETGSRPSMGDISENNDRTPSMLLFSGYGPRMFQSIKLPGRRRGCPSCSAEATISRDSLSSGSLDYAQFCGVNVPVDILRPDQRITAIDLALTFNKSNTSGFPSEQHARLVDVREKVQFDICHLPGSINIPFSELMAWTRMDEVSPELVSFLRETPPAAASDVATDCTSTMERSCAVTFVCRLGNDSQLAVRKLLDLGLPHDKVEIKDLKGGLSAWRKDVDETWPDY